MPVDAVWLGLLPASLLILISFRIPLSFGHMFTATAFPVSLFVLFYSLGYVDFHAVTWQRRQRRTCNAFFMARTRPLRNVGYAIILLAVKNTVGTRPSCMNTARNRHSVLSGRRLPASCPICKQMDRIHFGVRHPASGAISQFAPDVMTEALFMAGLGLFAAALEVMASRTDRRAVTAAAVGIVLATLAKSLGVVLVLPALLLVRFLPKGNRLSVSGVIVICGLATYALMAISSYTRTGIASPENTGRIRAHRTSRLDAGRRVNAPIRSDAKFD